MSRLHAIRLLRQLNEAAFVLNVALHDAAVATECFFDPSSESGLSRPPLLLASGRPAAESPLAEAAAA